MTTGPSRVSPEAVRAFERGLEAVFAADTVRELLDSVDVRALLSGEDLEEPIDYEGMGELVGQIAGRLVVKRTVGQFTPGQAVEQTVGYAIGGLVGRATVRTIARSDPERVAAAIERQFHPHHRTDPLPWEVNDAGTEPSRHVIEIEDPTEEGDWDGGSDSNGLFSTDDDPYPRADDSIETETNEDGVDRGEADGEGSGDDVGGESGDDPEGESGFDDTKRSGDETDRDRDIGRGDNEDGDRL